MRVSYHAVLLCCEVEGGVLERTDGLASVLAHLLEVLGSGILVLAALVGDVTGHLLGLLAADGLEVGRVIELAGLFVSVCRRKQGVFWCRATYLTPARRQAGGVATATRAATAKTARMVEAFANIVIRVVVVVDSFRKCYVWWEVGIMQVLKEEKNKRQE